MKDRIKRIFSSEESYYEPGTLTTDSDTKKQNPKESDPRRPTKDERNSREYALKKFATRRSVRKFSQEKVNWKCIFDIIDASLNSPCAGNIQNFNVIVIEDKHKIEEIARIESQQYWIATAPIVLAVVRESDRLKELYPVNGETYSIQNTAALIENILMLAHFHGFGACWVEACDGRVIGDLLGVPANERVDAIIPIGYPDEVCADCPKVPITEKIFFEEYGNRKK